MENDPCRLGLYT